MNAQKTQVNFFFLFCICLYIKCQYFIPVQSNLNLAKRLLSVFYGEKTFLPYKKLNFFNPFSDSRKTKLVT